MNKITKCKQCGAELDQNKKKVASGVQQFCSRECHNIWRSINTRGNKSPRWKDEDRTQICEICNKEFTVKPYRKREGKVRFCSRKCMGEWKSTFTGSKASVWKGGKITQICNVCGKEFKANQYEVKKGRGRFCSIACRGKWQSKERTGKRCPVWSNTDRPYTPDFSLPFKKSIRHRDNNICAICGKFGKEIHHIDYDKSNSTPNNCITLCKSCHGKTRKNRNVWQVVLPIIMINKASEGEYTPWIISCASDTYIRITRTKSGG